MKHLLQTLTMLAAAGCGGAGPSFGPTFADNVPDQLAEVLSALHRAPPRAARDVAVLTTEGGFALFDLEHDRVRWQVHAAIRTVPHLAGDFVVSDEGERVVLRDIHTGNEVASQHADALGLVGADGEGAWAIASLSTGGGVEARSRLVVWHRGSEAWSIAVPHAIGAPAVRGELAFVPWAAQNLSALSLDRGREIARLRTTDEVIGVARAVDGGLYYGQRALRRLTSTAASGSFRGEEGFGAAVAHLTPPLPFLPDAYQPAPAPASAAHRARILWQPAWTGDRVAPMNDSVYVLYYRLLFALDAAGSTARWVVPSEADLVAASVAPGGVVAVDARGRVLWMRATDGVLVGEIDTGLRPTGARFELARFAPRHPPPARTAPALSDQLVQAAQLNDARLASARALAVSLLAASPSAETTSLLLTVCEDRRAPPVVHAAACDALGRSPEGGDVIVAALERHASFLDGTSAPPAGALARAAASRREVRAVAPLLAHLRDPQTRAEDLSAILDALGALGERSAAAPVRDFLRLYHAEDPETGLVAAVASAAQALYALLGPVAEETIEEILADPLAPEDVRTRIAAIRVAREEAAARTPAPDDEAAASEPPPEAPAPTDTRASAARAARPIRTTTAHLDQALAPVRAQIVDCLRAANLRSARVVLVLAGDGTPESVAVTPAPVGPCVEPLVRGQRYPGNARGLRETLHHIVRR